MRVQLNQETFLKNEEEKRLDKALESVGIVNLQRNIKGSFYSSSNTYSVFGKYRYGNEPPHFVCTDNFQRVYILHLCDSCGMEFYGHWEYINAIPHMYKYIDGEYLIRDERRPEIEKLHSKGIDIYNRQFWEKRLLSIREIKDIDHCICCGEKLSKKPWLYLTSDAPKALQNLIPELSRTRGEYSYCEVEKDGISVRQCWKPIRGGWGVQTNFEEMREAVKCQDMKAAYSEAENYWKSCDFPVTSAMKPGVVTAIKGDSEQLKEYISNLLKLEMNIFFLKKRLPQLYYQTKKCDRDINFAMYSPRMVLKKDALDAERKYNDCLKKLREYQSGTLPIARPYAPSEPAYKTPGLFNKKKVLEENERLKETYQTALAAYEEALQRYEAEKERLLAEAEVSVKMAKEAWEALKTKADNFTPDETGSLPEVQFKTMMDQELENAEHLLRSMYQSRNELYSFNVIFGKYQNPVALSTFYEYLMAGRCTSLEGADGAYNIYEQEIRADRIIDQLGEVITQLEKIKSNQYMIYQELCTVNQNLDRLNQTTAAISESIQNIEKNVDTIAYNSTVTAYYSKMNAELTNALGYMVAFK